MTTPQEPWLYWLKAGEALPPAWTSASLPTVASHQAWLDYGQDNAYPQHLLVATTQSPTHKAILDLKADLIKGQGLLSDSGDWQAAVLEPQQFLLRLAADLALFNGCAIQVIWDKTATRIASLSPLPFEHIRIARPADGKAVSGYYYHSQWAKLGQLLRPQQPQYMAAFNPQLAKSQPRQLLYLCAEQGLLKPYPMAGYHAALPSVAFEQVYAQFMNAMMANGMFPLLHIAVEGDPGAEEKQQFYQDLKRKFAGVQKAGELLLTFGYEGGGRTTIHPIEMKADFGLFQAWAAEAKQRIVTAHRLPSPVLAGLPGTASLGSSGNEIAVAAEHFQAQVIAPLQELLVQGLQGLVPYLPGQPKGLHIKNAQPLRHTYGDALLQQILTRDELRATIGFGPLPVGTGVAANP